MKKINALLIGAIAGLAIAGAAVSVDTVSAASQQKPTIEQAQKSDKAAPKRELKDWEKKYYELHPEAKKQDEEKANPTPKRHHTDDDDIEWHHI